jgi:quinohemoprotein ethanol dehydrogenase
MSASMLTSMQAFDAIVRGGALLRNGMPRFEELPTDEIEGVRRYLRARAREAGSAGDK